MDIFTIKNEHLSVGIHPLGANLWSIKDREDIEYLWQGDVKTWPDKSLNIFPYVARLTQGKYTLAGQEYRMDIHGFIKDSILIVKEQSEAKLVLELTDSEETRKQYPYHFRYQICYELIDHEIRIAYHVKNLDEKMMYFGVGGHPGFNVPLENGLTFEDYRLEFASVVKAKRVGMSDDCFVLEEDTEFNLQGGKILPLTHDLFDDDAIILKQMDRQVTLLSDKGKKQVKVTYPDMPYLGIWHWPQSDAAYVCIEPWSSLPSRKNVIEALETQDNLLVLAPGKEYVNTWSIEIEESFS